MHLKWQKPATFASVYARVRDYLSEDHLVFDWKLHVVSDHERHHARSDKSAAVGIALPTECAGVCDKSARFCDKFAAIPTEEIEKKSRPDLLARVE